MYDIKKYETVAMLCLSDAEREQLGGLVEALEAGFGGLGKVDTEGVEPLVSVLSIHNVLREDIAEKNFSRDEIMENALEQYDGYFQVPGTLD